jgi:HD superfamily phosphohydrolase
MSTFVLLPRELTPWVLNTEYKTFHDAIHGYMKVSNLACRIIDSKLYQRTDDLSQLGTCSKVFHTARHTRFDHGIGTYHLADLITTCIANRTKPHKIEDYLKSIPELQDYFNRTYNGIAIFDKYICELIKIAALVHDIGHGPFSHVFDDIFLPSVKKIAGPNDSHEDRSGLFIEDIITNDSILSEVIKPPEIQFIKNVINPGKEHIGFLYQIVSNYLNGLDVDKYDYILRDSANTGFFTSFECSRLVNDVYIVDNTICYTKQSIYDAFKLYQSRYDLHKNVYTHKGVVAAQFMIAELMTLLDPILKISESVDSIDKFCKITDNYILKSIDLINPATFNDEQKLLFKKAQIILDRYNNHNLYVFINNITTNKKITITIDDFKKIDDYDSKYDSDILIYQSRIGYVSGNKKNPFDNMFVCSTKNADDQKLLHVKQSDISHLIPQVYQEFITLVFYRIRGDYEGKEKINKWFNQIVASLN